MPRALSSDHSPGPTAVAERGLAEPFHDPSTTGQAFDRIHDILWMIAVREIPSGEHRDARGELRLKTRSLQWSGYVLLGFEELRAAGRRFPRYRAGCAPPRRTSRPWRRRIARRRSTAKSRCSTPRSRLSLTRTKSSSPLGLPTRRESVRRRTSDLFGKPQPALGVRGKSPGRSRRRNP